jgi:hypothetical protein
VDLRECRLCTLIDERDCQTGVAISSNASSIDGPMSPMR